MSKWATAAENASRGAPPRWQDDHRNDDSDWLEEETKTTQQSSLSSSRRALQRLQEVESMAATSLNTVNQQSESFNRMERRLDQAGASAKTADAKADHLKSLNRFFFLPSFGGKKVKDREESYDRQNISNDWDSKQSKQRERGWNDRIDRHERQELKPASKVYDTYVGIEKDETEDEIHDNVNAIHSGLSRLKLMGIAMNDEMDMQSEQLNRISSRADSTRTKVKRLNNKVDGIVERKRY